MLYICQSIHSSLISWRDWYFKTLQDQIQNAQNRITGVKSNCIYITYKNTVMPYGCHIYAKLSDMENATMCAYPQSDNELPHWKCVMRCCAKYPSINIHEQEIDDQYFNTITSISFHIYHLIARCSTRGRLPLNDEKSCCKCK